MMHPDTELRFVSEEIGLGVFATKLIRMGTIVWIHDELDLDLSEEYVTSLDPLRQDIILKYAYVGEHGGYVLCWDHARYVNHSAHPNMVPTAYGFELASRDILPGEELRCDYGSLGQDEEFECEPEPGSFRTQVFAEDWLYFYRQWDELAKAAFQYFNRVNQPLRFLIRPEYVDKISAIAAGQAEPDSILSLVSEQDPGRPPEQS